MRNNVRGTNVIEYPSIKNSKQNINQNIEKNTFLSRRTKGPAIKKVIANET